MEINTIKTICDSPVEMNEVEEYLVVDENQSKEIFTDKVKNIINFLRKNNPINEKKINSLFGESHKDLVLMRHFNLIDVQEITKNSLDNIITLNKNLRVLN